MKWFAFPLLVAFAVGCTPPAKPLPTTAPPGPAEEPGHSHERGKMLLADAGKYHALLTAHLSKKGHELDIFFETVADNPVPVAIPVESFVAEIQVRSGDGEVKKVEFKPAPADERPAGEPAGKCSHFVASVPWLEPDTPVRVTVELNLDGKKVTARWNDFLPRKYAHHED